MHTLSQLSRIIGFTAAAVLSLLAGRGANVRVYGAATDAPAISTGMQTEDRIVGRWLAEQTSGPEIRGELRIDVDGNTWQAIISGIMVAVVRNRDELRFTLPDGKGEFRGRLDAEATTIIGHWIQPAGAVSYQPRATPIELLQSQTERWIGLIAPLEERLHFYVHLYRGLDGSLRAAIRNPESNRWGHTTFNVSVQGDEVLLADGRQQLRGRFDPQKNELSLPLVRGALLRLTRYNETESGGFYPRTPKPGAFQYQKPESLKDGWSTASLADVALASEPIRELIQSILDADPTDRQTVPIHSILIARRGKLVLEEYFHGFDRERPHDLRSAGKTLGPLLVGVARDHGAAVEPHTSVYDLFPEYRPFANWDQRKARLTVRDLMTMTSGLACDDNDDSSPGHEDRLQEQQAQPNWYKYTLDLPMQREPGGTHAIYSSAVLNLVGGVASRVAGLWNGELFDRHVARPLGFGRYHLNLTPTGDVYTGGGAYLLPRDQLKIGQLYLDGGTWNGTRVLSKEWVEWSTTPHATFERPVTDTDQNHQYGFGWHVHHFTVGNRTFRQYAAEGNGGQFIMVFPDLEMVVVVNGGAYGSNRWYHWGLEVIPRYLIPAGTGPNAK